MPDESDSLRGTLFDYPAAAPAANNEAFGGAGEPGLVPDPSSETGAFLKDDGTWAAPTTSGTWTPVLTGVANVDSTSNVKAFTWIKIGSNLMCWGQFDVDHTSTGTLTTVDLSLPSSGVTVPAFTAAENIFGNGSGDGMGIRGGFVQAKPVSSLARYNFRGVGSASNTHILSFLVKGVS